MENGDSIASVATNHKPSSSTTQMPALRMADIVQPMPKGMRVMEMQITATAKTARPKLTKKPGTYATLSSSSQSMQIPLHTSSAAHQANRFLSCRWRPHIFSTIKCSDEMENGLTVPCPPPCRLVFSKSRPGIYHRMQMCLRSKSTH